MVALGGHAWLLQGGMRGCSGGMHGCSGGACVVLFGGACVVLFGGGVCGFIRGACVILFGGACVVLFRGAGGQGACVVLFGGHAWFYLGGMHGFILGGVHGFIWGGMHGFFSFFGYNEIRSMSGRYASYWNAFLWLYCGWSDETLAQGWKS